MAEAAFWNNRLTADKIAPMRLAAIDALRGFAVLGILLANVPYFFHRWDQAYVDLARTPADRVIAHAIGLLVDGKFYAIFSFLFGVGAGLQLREGHTVSYFHRRYGVLALIMVMYLLLGCLMDAMAMIILTVPIIFPVIMQLGFDPIWFGVIIVMTVELGLIHPPVGMNVFVIKSVVQEVSFTTIFKGVIPFVVTDLIRLVILIAFPVIALWLPSRM